MANATRAGDFEIVSLNISENRGTRKRPIPRAIFAVGRGVEGDAHAGVLEDRQVSLLAIEEIEKASAACAKASPGAAALSPGDFAENVTTRGVVLHELPLGTRLYLGTAELEISRIGKECHAACEIRRLVGDCAMPRRGVFARVVRGGEAGVADSGRYSLR
jgi:MOSC domain-containing protein YiiM